MQALKLVILLAIVCWITGCSTQPYGVFLADDKTITDQIVGRWIKDESYYYGRFIGILTLEKDGRCIREFGVFSDNQGTLQPLHIQRGYWRIEKGFIMFYDCVTEGLEPGGPKYRRKEKTRDEREWVKQINGEVLLTVDEGRKTDSYKRLK